MNCLWTLILTASVSSNTQLVSIDIVHVILVQLVYNNGVALYHVTGKSVDHAKSRR